MLKKILASCFFLFLPLGLLAEVSQLIVVRGLADWQQALLKGAEIGHFADGIAYVRPESTEWQPDRDSDLLLHFNHPVKMDNSGNHQIMSNYQLSAVAGVKGDKALLLNGSKGIFLLPGKQSFLGGGQDVGAFAIDFWFKPTYSRNGEFLFEWDGLIDRPGLKIPQRISARFQNQRLLWTLKNIFIHPEQQQLIVELSSDVIIPNRWYHHGLYYDYRSNKLELMIDNRIEDVQYTTVNGNASGEPATLMMNNSYSFPFILGRSFHGYIDEFYLSTAAITPPYFRRSSYRALSEVVIGPLDMKSYDATLQQLDVNAGTPDRSKLVFYYNLSNNPSTGKLIRGEQPAVTVDDDVWTMLPVGSRLPLSPATRGRYLLLKAVFLGDIESLQPPWLSEVTVSYRPGSPLPQPAQISLRQVGSNSLEVSWKQVANSRISGYRVYLGERSQIYFDNGRSVDVGKLSSYTFEDLAVGKQYFVTVIAYDNYELELDNVAASTEKSIHLLPHFQQKTAIGG